MNYTVHKLQSANVVCFSKKIPIIRILCISGLLNFPITQHKCCSTEVEVNSCLRVPVIRAMVFRCGGHHVTCLCGHRSRRGPNFYPFAQRPRLLYPRESGGLHCTGGWEGLGAWRDVHGKSHYLSHVINLLAPELLFLILAQPVYKM